MTCHRRYTFTFDEQLDQDRVLHALTTACERDWWFTEPAVQGADAGRTQVVIQVAARDQWWAHKRAMTLMETAVWPTELPVPEWETLPPHTNRGRYR